MLSGVSWHECVSYLADRCYQPFKSDFNGENTEPSSGSNMVQAMGAFGNGLRPLIGPFTDQSFRGTPHLIERCGLHSGGCSLPMDRRRWVGFSRLNAEGRQGRAVRPREKHRWRSSPGPFRVFASVTMRQIDAEREILRANPRSRTHQPLNMEGWGLPAHRERLVAMDAASEPTTTAILLWGLCRDRDQLTITGIAPLIRPEADFHTHNPTTSPVN